MKYYDKWDDVAMEVTPERKEVRFEFSVAGAYVVLSMEKVESLICDLSEWVRENYYS